MVNYQCENRVAYIILNRPEKRNALNFEMVSALKDALNKAAEDSNCKVIVIRSSAEVFCSGADLASLQKMQSNTWEENFKDSKHLAELFELIYSHAKPIIAQVEGAALAGGCGLANICDFTFATPESKFAYTETRIGFVPAIVMVFLIRKIGEAQARPLLLSGDIIPATQAYQMGLVYQLIPAESISKTVSEFAEKLANQCSGQSLALTKKMIAEVQNLTWENAVNYAAKNNADARQSEDCKKGIQSFLNKEKIIW